MQYKHSAVAHVNDGSQTILHATLIFIYKWNERGLFAVLATATVHRHTLTSTYFSAHWWYEAKLTRVAGSDAAIL